MHEDIVEGPHTYMTDYVRGFLAAQEGIKEDLRLLFEYVDTDGTDADRREAAQEAYFRLRDLARAA